LERSRSLALADLAKAVLLTAAYVALARIGLTTHAINVFASLVWAPTGLSLAAMLLLGTRFWPSIALGAVIANLWTGAPLPVALAIGAGNTLEALLGAYALRSIPGFRNSLDRLADVIALILLAAVASTAVSATIGVGSLALSGVIPFERAPVTWRAWWLGDAIGNLIFAPLLLTWSAAHDSAREARSRRLEAAALALSLALVSVYIFDATRGGMAALLAPFLVWASVRFELRGAARAMFFVSVVAIWGTTRGHGPFIRDTVESGLFDLQAFMALTAGTFLVLGAITAERRRAKDEAEAASQAKDRFLATLSHELRTPLTPVLALSSVLEKSTALPAEARAQMEVVRRNAELEARLIDDLLDLTRISRGKLSVAPEPIALAETLEHVLDICQREAASRGVLIERQGHLANVMVRADPTRLRQVFWNVVKNAVEFTPSGGRILVRATLEAPNRIAVEVQDTGAGIDPSDLGRIFEPFEQAGPRTRGLGLGLSISRALVEAQGGTLTASSDGQGRGATFRIELEALPGIAPAVRPVPPAAARPFRLVTRRVLLVEDHVDTLRAARALLAELACDVVAATSVREALAAAQAQPFDLVLSDLGLPDGNGLELMAQLRDRYGLSGIAVTGYGMEEDLRRSSEAGFVDHLVKPITFARLESAIDRFFEEREESTARTI
jgi:signal transduction histidine kinase/ActR/RegA family two-component response regulator